MMQPSRDKHLLNIMGTGSRKAATVEIQIYLFIHDSGKLRAITYIRLEKQEFLKGVYAAGSEKRNGATYTQGNRKNSVLSSLPREGSLRCLRGVEIEQTFACYIKFT